MKIFGYTITVKIEKIANTPVEKRRALARLVDEKARDEIRAGFFTGVKIPRVKAVRELGIEYFPGAEVYDNNKTTLRWAKEWVEMSFSNNGEGEIL